MLHLSIIIIIITLFITLYTDSVTCLRCHQDFWSNLQKDGCVEKETEFLSFEEIMGILLTTISIVGAFITMIIAVIFFKYKNTQ